MSDLISRQAAIDALKHNHDVYSHNFHDDPIDKYTSAIITADIDSLVNLPSAQPEQRWIPCSERLPEPEKKDYWICTDGGYQCQCRWTNINHFWTGLTVNWHWHIMDDVPQYSKVVAWKPLPEPYKEGEQDD